MGGGGLTACLTLLGTSNRRVGPSSVLFPVRPLSDKTKWGGVGTGRDYRHTGERDLYTGGERGSCTLVGMGPCGSKVTSETKEGTLPLQEDSFLGGLEVETHTSTGGRGWNTLHSKTNEILKRKDVKRHNELTQINRA